MTQNTPGTDAGHPEGGAKPHRGKVVHATDEKILTDDDKARKPGKPQGA